MDQVYVDLEGNRISTAGLDQAERDLVQELQERARCCPTGEDFSRYWMPRVAQFYDARGLGREESRQTAPYQIAQDLNERLDLADAWGGDARHLLKGDFHAR